MTKNFGRHDLMAVAAFRYALGRMTYIVSDCADWLVEQYEALIAALAPSPCPVCGECMSYLAIENGHLMHRTCDKCGSDFAGAFECKWNKENLERRFITTGEPNASLSGLPLGKD